MKRFALLITVLCIGVSVFCQSVINKSVVHSNTVFGTYQLFRITSLNPRLNNGKYERALQQNDVIGNDYLNDLRIFGINANHDDSHTPTNYHPVDGFKRTFCGTLHSYYYSGHWYSDIANFDKDQCIELEIDENNPLIKGYKYLYNQYRFHNVLQLTPPPPKIITDSNWFFEPWNIIEGEINVSKNEADFSFSDLRSNVCMFGPWVLELYDSSETHLKEHKNNNEIHPIEQFWYKDQAIGKGNTSYRMNFFVDGSERFNNKGDYYGIGPSEQLLFRPWSKVPMNGSFYLAFEINLKNKEHQTYWTEPISDFGVKPSINDGKNHFLIYGQDTLVSIFEGEPESVNISFDNVGYKPLKSNFYDRSVIQGFIVFSTRITGPAHGIPLLNDRGDFRLRVERQIKSTAKQNLLLQIEKIKRLKPNSFRHFNPVTNITYTDPPPPIPDTFNENQVFLTMSDGTQTNSLLIPNLPEGEETTIEKLQCLRKGFLTDEYRFEINCTNGYDGQELGNLIIAGIKPGSADSVRNTILLYSQPLSLNKQAFSDDDDHFNPSLRVSLFQITYKVKAVPEYVNPNNSN